MSRRDHRERYEEWLEAEALGDERAADAALTALFEGLPLEAPSEGFAARALTRIGTQIGARVRAERAAPATEVSPSAGRWAAAVLGLLSLGTLGLSAAAVTLLPRLEVGGLVATFNALVGAIWEWIASGIALWGEAAEWSEILVRVVAVPGVAWTLAGTALVASLAFTLLRRILHDLHGKEPIEWPS